MATDYLRAVLADPVVQLRRLVVGEANRLPELGSLYYQQAPPGRRPGPPRGSKG